MLSPDSLRRLVRAGRLRNITESHFTRYSLHEFWFALFPAVGRKVAYAAYDAYMEGVT